MARKDDAKPPGQSVHEQAASTRLLIETAIHDGNLMQITLASNVFAMVFSLNSELLREMNRHGQSFVFKAMEGSEAIHVFIVKPSKKEINLTRALVDPEYRANLVAGWYKGLATAYSHPVEQVAYKKARDVFEKASAPLGLVRVGETRLPGMFDLDYGKDTVVQQELNSLRDLYDADMVSSPHLIHPGLSDFIEHMWTILEEVAPQQIKQLGLPNPPKVRENASMGGVSI